MANQFTLSIFLPVNQKTLYEAWLNGKAHAAFTGGGAAKVSPKVGGSFSAWDGYISGKNLELHPYDLIVQSWRTTEFAEDAPDSTLKVVIKAHKQGAKLTLIHGNIPKGAAAEYKKGWKDYYFTPMEKFFQKNVKK